MQYTILHHLCTKYTSQKTHHCALICLSFTGKIKMCTTPTPNTPQKYNRTPLRCEMLQFQQAIFKCAPSPHQMHLKHTTAHHYDVKCLSFNRHYEIMHYDVKCQCFSLQYPHGHHPYAKCTSKTDNRAPQHCQMPKFQQEISK